MKNTYIKNIDRVEYMVTYSCTSHCRHCSVGERKKGGALEAERAAGILKELSSEFKIDSVMTFGGEPLLYPETVCKIHAMAKECGIPVRQIITNGCFTKSPERRKEVVKMLADCGVNEILLSVDGFHAEYVDMDTVYALAKELKENYKEVLRIHPAWVVSEEDDNTYNQKTRECLEKFADLQLPVDEGNVIFPSGNAVRYLGEYFEKEPMDMKFHCGDAPYSTKLDAIDGISVNPNGDVIACSFPIGNINQESILEILKRYNPYDNQFTKALLEQGLPGLLACTRENNLDIDVEEYYSPCELCQAVAYEVTKERL